MDIKNKIFYILDDILWNQLNDNIKISICNKIHNDIANKVDNQIWDTIVMDIRHQIRNQANEY